jgi:hypothetical protein
VSEPDEVRSASGEKSIGLINGTLELASRETLIVRTIFSLGVALVVGLQVSSGQLFPINKVDLPA